MAIVRLPIVELSRISSNYPFLNPIQNVTGGLVAMIFAVSGKPYKLVGFSAGMNAGNGGGNTTWLDGVTKIPVHILVPPSFDPIADGVLQLFYVQNLSPPDKGVSMPIVAYAKLEGVIYPNVSQVVAAFNIPNTASFNIGVNNAALIVEDYQESATAWRV